MNRPSGLDRIVTVLSDAVFAATANARELLAGLRSSMSSWQDRLDLWSDSVGWRLLHALPGQPVVNAEYVVTSFKVSGVGAQRALKELTEAGILREFTGRKRSRM